MKQRNIILFDLPAVRENLLPLSYTRPIADFLVGITTLRKKWESFLVGEFSYSTVGYLSEKYPMKTAEENLFIASNIIATEGLARRLDTLEPGDVLMADTMAGQRVLVGFKGGVNRLDEVIHSMPAGIVYEEKVDAITTFTTSSCSTGARSRPISTYLPRGARGRAFRAATP